MRGNREPAEPPGALGGMGNVPLEILVMGRAA
jgi:hypothetical protein